ncbi:hypothetical protein JTE90_018478 [Oedothorax gibbosus]|uniref:Uncharacterized protein n=1 Tax=Oedothorax gibbosus TaxID=931172 RepID=A0AAV6UEI6_9ARAC|nr:hypothetical protein JTE90_018478 [Oedothorax gibbosus]
MPNRLGSLWFELKGETSSSPQKEQVPKNGALLGVARVRCGSHRSGPPEISALIAHRTITSRYRGNKKIGKHQKCTWHRFGGIYGVISRCMIFVTPSPGPDLP